MPIINAAVIFSLESSRIIESKKTDAAFTHNDWGSDDLQSVRREAREHYRESQRLICAYCLNPVSTRSASGAPIDHIVPKSLRLEFIFEPRNLCVTCQDCNEIKSSTQVLNEYIFPISSSSIRYPTASNSFKIVHPHIDEYSQHIYKANRIYVDLSPEGLWTIGVCKLNRFFHRFGACEELVADIAIINEEELFHQT